MDPDLPPPGAALRKPASKRISLPTSHRLTSITENGNGNSHSSNSVRSSTDDSTSISSKPPSKIPPVPPLPLKSILRRSDPSPTSPSYPPPPSRAGSSSLGGRTLATTAPSTFSAQSYEWVSNPSESTAAGGGAEGDVSEKFAELQREAAAQRSAMRRGGWRRLALLVGVGLLVAAGFGVGLGVGLTVDRSGSGNGNASVAQPASVGGGGGETGSGNANATLPFPLGSWSVVTALKDVETACTSNAATWNCFPYTTYNPADSSTYNSSRAIFNWIITNTSSTYATPNSPTLPSTSSPSSSGIPSNLTLSSTHNPFSITISAQPLTNIPPSSTNSSSARYTFTIPLPKSVIPSTPLCPSSSSSSSSSSPQSCQTSTCLFNSTIFSATLYLSLPRDYPAAQQENDPGLGGFQQWPFAAEVRQVSPGGVGVPACVATVGGGDVGVAPVSSRGECVCGWGNFG